MERLGIIDGVDLPGRTDLVVPLRRRDSLLLCALGIRRCPQIPLASKRDTSTLEESRQSSPLLPQRARRSRRLRDHSQTFHPRCIGAGQWGRDSPFHPKALREELTDEADIRQWQRRYAERETTREHLGSRQLLLAI